MKLVAVAALLLSTACAGAVGSPAEAPARIDAQASIDPPAQSLDGLSLVLSIDDSTALTPFRTVFDGSAQSCDSAAEQIRQAQNIDGRIAVSCHDGALRFEAVEPGPDVTLSVAYGSALPVLGLSERTSASGQ